MSTWFYMVVARMCVCVCVRLICILLASLSQTIDIYCCFPVHAQHQRANGPSGVGREARFVATLREKT